MFSIRIFEASTRLTDAHVRKGKIHFRVILLILSLVATKQISSSCSCGTNSLSNTHIRTGVHAKPYEFPWQVALTDFSNRLFCGGTLLNNKYVLTAAHCLFKMKASQVIVVLGEHDTHDRRNVRRRKYLAEKLIMNPTFDRTFDINDIGLVKMKESVKFTDSQKPACLLRPASNLVGVEAIVSGWGRTSENGNSSHVLMKVEIPIISLDECRRAHGHNFIVSSMLCGMYKPGGKDACQGDSGGPLTYYHLNRYYLIGLVSWGFGCGRPNYPSIYTRVDSFYHWIDENTSDAEACSD